MRGSGIGAAFALMTGAGALLGGAGQANADVSFSVDTSSLSQDMHFSQFDTSLGTLTEVDIMLSNSATGGTALASITGGEGGEFATASRSGTLQITGPSSLTAFSAGTSVFAHCMVNVGGGGFCSDGPHDENNPTFSPNTDMVTTNLTDFEGSGTFTLTAAIADPVDDDALSGGNGTQEAISNLTWSGEVSVNFIYTPTSQTPTPEPASLALLGVGIAGIGFVRRRRGR